MFPELSKTASSAIVSLLLLDQASAQAPAVLNGTQALTGFPLCDALIAANLSHAVHLSSSPRYQPLVEGTWALNTRKSPWCFVLPSTVSEVARVVNTLSSLDTASDWHIALRSGGHGSDNSNNIATGVTIDMSQLNATTYDSTAKIASINTGSRWGAVYTTLDKLGVSVTGGRDGIVGVGGFALGGGNSFYTGRTGFTCGNVINYEVVLSTGEIVNANATNHSDLWRALKGGSSNFGIVTRFDMETFSAQNLTIANMYMAPNYSSEVFDAVHGCAKLDQSYQDNAMLSALLYDPTSDQIMLQTIEVNTRGALNTTAFGAFNSIPALTPSKPESLSLLDTATNRSQVKDSALNAGGSVAFANDRRIMFYCETEHTNLVASVKTLLGPNNFSTILELQPLFDYYSKISLERNPHTRLLLTGGVTFVNPDTKNQYPVVLEQVRAMIKRIDTYAKSLGSGDDFIYLNYAHANQDALGSYGAENVAFMKKVADKYDCQGFFQKKVPGGFKLSRTNLLNLV